jgi:hypothetical protein
MVRLVGAARALPERVGLPLCSLALVDNVGSVDIPSSAWRSLPESGPACPGPIRRDRANTGTGNAALFHIKD